MIVTTLLFIHGGQDLPAMLALVASGATERLAITFDFTGHFRVNVEQAPITAVFEAVRPSSSHPSSKSSSVAVEQ